MKSSISYQDGNPVAGPGHCQVQDKLWAEAESLRAPEVLGQGIHTLVLTRKLVNRVAVTITFFFWRILSFLTHHIYSGIFFSLTI